MKRPIFLATVAALAVSTLMGSVAMADSHKRDRGHDNHRSSERHDQRYEHGRHWDRGNYYGHDHVHSRYRVVRYYPPQGYRHYSWYRGARLPAAYYQPRYVVQNYGAYRLHHPPHGYHWVRVNNDVVLAAVTTGLVLHVVNGLFY